MRRRLAVLLAFVVALSAGAAHARDQEAARAHYERGVTRYDVGKFDEAVAEFQRAYELDPNPNYLYNIAQAHRQKGNAAKAVFFYRRYLKRKPDAPNRAVVEQRIAELEEVARRQQAAKEQPPSGLADEPEQGDPARAPEGPPPRGRAPGAVSPTPSAQPEATAERSPTTKPATPLAREAMPNAGHATTAVATDDGATAAGGTATVRARARAGADLGTRVGVAAGPTFVRLGDGPDVPVQVAVVAGGALRLPLRPVAIDVGVTATYTPVPYLTITGEDDGVASLIGGLASVTGRLEVARRVDLRAELSAGLVLFTGLGVDNPFSDDGAPVGTLALAGVRAGVGVDVEIVERLTVSATPLAYTFSPTRQELDDDIGAVTRLDVLVGVTWAP